MARPSSTAIRPSASAACRGARHEDSDNPNVIGIKHMAFGVRDAEAALATYARFLDVPADTAIIDYPKSKNSVALFNLGGIEYQLCQSMDAGRALRHVDRSSAAREGLHHICYAVDEHRQGARARPGEGRRAPHLPGLPGVYGSHPHPEG